VIRPRTFTSWLALHFASFVALKRASGAGYESQERQLLAFDRYVARNSPEPPLLRQALVEYLTSHDHLSPRSRENLVGAVWPALAYAINHGAQVELLPARPPKPPRYWREKQPRILSISEVRSVLAAARQLPPVEGLRPATTATLIGLLYTTGLRIGEALALDISDFDLHERILTVRRGKFGKSRAIPLRESTGQALARYIGHPRRPLRRHAAAPIFVSCRRRRLSQPAAWKSVRTACQAAGLSEPLPRLHDFRHSFAVRLVTGWYSQGRDVNSLLPALSTYLGHISVENTRTYLVANGVLLQQAAKLFADRTKALDEVQS
jgi:integrase/recombinase XerD